MSQRGRKKQEVHSDGLVQALNFVSTASRSIGEPYQLHMLMRNKWAVAFDGTLAAGCPIEDDISACPHTELLKNALGKCKEALTITQLDNGQLSIVSGKFKVKVPCIGVELLQYVEPDKPIAPINNELRNGISSIMHLTKEDGLTVVHASLLLEANTVTATNGSIIAQYWHGIDLPPQILITKQFAIAVSKCTKNLVSFGYSNESVTFYYEDNSWIKTQRFVGNWPDVNTPLNFANVPTPLPDGFWEGVETVASFGDGKIYMKEGKIQSSFDSAVGASFDVYQMVEAGGINAKALISFKPLIEKMDLLSNPSAFHFYGKNLRGIIARVR